MLVAWLGAVSAGSAEAPDVDPAERARPSALAGSWYPADAATLADTVDTLLAERPPSERPAGTVRALIVPHAGYRYSGATAAAAFALVNGAHYHRVVVLAPAHQAAFDGLSVANVDAYQTPLGPVPLDREGIARLRASPLVRAVPDAHEREHAIEIELPFLQRTLSPGWGLVPILVGRLGAEDYATAAELIRPLLDERSLLVVSSDFTHYGPRFGYLPFPADQDLAERIQALDDGALERIVAGDAAGLLRYQAETGITICGYRPLALLLQLLPPEARVHRIAYATSAQLTGDRHHSVSYAALAVTAPSPLSASRPSERGAVSTAPRLDDAALQRLHGLAVLGIRRTVLGEDAVPDNEILSAVEDLPASMMRPAGAFVTLWKHGVLRGCVGHVLDDVPLYEAVLRSGANVARDSRFRPLRVDELDALEVEVSVLTPPRPIRSVDELQIGEHGIRLRKGGRDALYLPEVAPTMGWDRDTTLSQLALKAGLPADVWREDASLEVFTSTEYRAPYMTPATANGSSQR
jgi:hypothetical protein